MTHSTTKYSAKPPSHRMHNTSVALRASAKAAAPWSPILFSATSRSVSDVLASWRQRTHTMESHGYDTRRRLCDGDNGRTPIHVLHLMPCHTVSSTCLTIACLSLLPRGMSCHVVSVACGMYSNNPRTPSRTWSPAVRCVKTRPQTRSVACHPVPPRAGSYRCVAQESPIDISWTSTYHVAPQHRTKCLMAD